MVVVRAVLLSDTHNQHDKITLPSGDILIHCGDFSGTGNYKDHHNFSKWMGQQNFDLKICIPGNHDRYSQDQTNITKQMFKDHGVHLLIDEELEYKGKKFYGSPWTPTFGRWNWMVDRGEPLAKKWDGIPENLDVLITHGPPHRILDVSVYTNTYCGCEALLYAVEQKQPKFHVFGHIHYYGGLRFNNANTEFVNASVCNEDYKPLNEIQVIEL